MSTPEEIQKHRSHPVDSSHDVFSSTDLLAWFESDFVSPGARRHFTEVADSDVQAAVYAYNSRSV